MQGIAVTLLTEDKERLSILQTRLEGTHMGSNVFSHVGFPSGPTDTILRQIQDVRTEVVLVDIDPHNSPRAIQAIELIHANTSEIAIFAVGGMQDPNTIVSSMRAGAREYLERITNADSLIEALTRFAALRGKARSSASGRARIFAVANAKGGAGATTVAVNTAIALQEAQGSVLLVDFAPLGHASLHLNVRPSFGVTDALQNLHRLDTSLLQGLMTPCKGGLQLLAGAQQPSPLTPTIGELAGLFDLLVSHFRYVVIDCSGRMDHTARMLCDLANAVLLVAQADVVSLWSAARVRTFLEEGGGRDRVRLVINRFKKIPGFGDEDVEQATNCKLLWKLPNNYQSVSPAIDKGVPVALHGSDDISRSYKCLAELLAEASATADGSLDLSYKHDKLDPKKKTVGRLLVAPLRVGQ